MWGDKPPLRGRIQGEWVGRKGSNLFGKKQDILKKREETRGEKSWCQNVEEA